MRRILFVVQICFFISLAACSQTGKKNVKAFYLGHSLSDGIPELLWGLTREDATGNFDYGYQRINGTPLRNQWNQMRRKNHMDYLDHTDKEMLKTFDSTIIDEGAHLYRFFDQEKGLPSGEYTHLVMTESVPRYIAEGWGNIEDTYRYVDSFYTYARQFNRAIKPYLYEVWHCINSGTPEGCDHEKATIPFRERLTSDLAMWESVVNKFNSKHPLQKMQLIPVGQALGHLYDAIERKELPGIQSMRDLFTDAIHVNDTLRYFNACVHYAVLFERSPVGLTNAPKRLTGEPFVTINKEMATRLQTIAWESVQRYRSSGKK